MPILNAKRIRDYPRLMLITTWMVMGLNLLLHQGWIGAFGQVIAGDFVVYYSTGSIYRSTPSLIYDYQTQNQTQQALVAPSILLGFNPFINPPYLAPLLSILTFFPLQPALFIWTILALLSVFFTVKVLLKLVPGNDQIPGLTFGQLVIIVLSFFPFIEGLLAGQNHWLTLLIISGIVYSMMKEKWALSGILAGLLIYKPQFILGFIILWLIWGKFKALISFAVIAGAWVGLFALINGFDLYRTYIQLSQVFIGLPFMPGFPNYLLVTFYGFLTSFFPQDTQSILFLLSQFLFIMCAVGLAWLAYKLRKKDMYARIPAVVAALILPLIATPYALLHDMVILIPAFVLWAIYSNSRNFTFVSASVYLGAFFLTFVAALTKVAWVSLLTMGLSIAIAVWVISNREPLAGLSVAQ